MYQKNKAKKETKKQIDFEKYKLFEIPFSKVKFENDKSLFIDIENGDGIFINKNNCFKSKKYEYKPVFLIKIFEEFIYEIRNVNNWESIERNASGKELISLIEYNEENEEY